MALDDSILRSILLASKRKEPENAVPLLMIGLGGTGAEVIKRVKLRAGWLGLKNSVRFLVVDTDASSKNGRNELPGLDDHEFVLLSNPPALVILDNPNLHESASERLDLQNEEVFKQLRDFVRVAQDGAGQVPRNATLKLFGSFTVFRNRLREAISHLNERWANLRFKGTKAQSFNTVLIGSVCGGTGAGMLLDTACLLENELYQHNSQLMSILALPEVFDFDVRGKKDDYERMRSNAYATLRELEFFRSGDALKQVVSLGREIKTPKQDMLKSVSLVSRIDANGQDLRSSSAVFDSIGLYLGAFISETMQQTVMSGLCNDNPMDIDPMLTRKRNVGSIAATALSLPVYEFLGYCAYRQARAFVSDHIIGRSLKSDEVETIVDEWLNVNKIEERMSKSGNHLNDQLKRLVSFDAAEFSNRLYIKAGRKSQHHPDKEFITLFEKEKTAWRSELESLSVKLEGRAKGLYETVAKALDSKISGLIDGFGLEAAISVCNYLTAVLQATGKELTEEIRNHGMSSSKSMAAADKTCDWLKKFPGNIGTDPARQTATVNSYNGAINDDGMSLIKGEAGKILAKLADVSGKMAKDLAKQLKAWKKNLDYLQQRGAEHRLTEHSIPYGESMAELSVLTPKLAEEFYGNNKMDQASFQGLIRKKQDESFRKFVTESGSAGDVWSELVMMAGHHFADRILDLDIGTLVENEIAAGSELGIELEKRLKLVLTGCTPMWQARPRQAETQFEDGLVAGLSVGSKEKVEDIVNESNVVNAADPMYQANFQVVRTNDRMRIYAIRRVAGGMPYYLPQWQEYKKCYESWHQKTKGNSSHTLPERLASKLPRMEPLEEVTRGEKAFAIALAFGFIAKRGANYYLTLSQGKKDGKYLVEMESQEDNIVFAGKKLRDPLGTMQKMIDTEEISFKSKASPKGMSMLNANRGDRRQSAMVQFSGDDKSVDAVLNAFESLCEIASSADVADEIDEHIERQIQAGIDNREIDVLRELAQTLRAQ